MVSDASQIAIVILAAGASKRLGTPKQLVTYKGNTLLGHIIDECNSSSAAPVIVVLGYEAAEIAGIVKDKNVHLSINDKWQEGMASSIRRGIQTTMEIAPMADAVILVVCDQPYLDKAHIEKMIHQHLNHRQNIIPSVYDNVAGTPVLFPKSYFPELLTLSGDTGAKPLLRKYSNEIIKVEFPMGIVDVDTPDDLSGIETWVD